MKYFWRLRKKSNKNEAIKIAIRGEISKWKKFFFSFLMKYWTKKGKGEEEVNEEWEEREREKGGRGRKGHGGRWRRGRVVKKKKRSKKTIFGFGIIDWSGQERIRAIRETLSISFVFQERFHPLENKLGDNWPLQTTMMTITHGLLHLLHPFSYHKNESTSSGRRTIHYAC